MTRRERLENKLARRQEWAGKAHTRAEAASDRAHTIADSIPMGQPILVGHHSERHHRADLRRIETATRTAVAEYNLAEYHEQMVAGLARQLDTSIYSDDADAIAALEARIAEREAQAEHMVMVNAAWRKSKGQPAAFAALAGIDQPQAERIAARIESAYNWEKQPFPAWSLSNLRGSIRRDRERIKAIATQQERRTAANAAPGGVTIEGSDYVRVTFAEKPARDILVALKAAGFYWQAGSWLGNRAKLPETVAEQEQEK